MDNPNLLLLLLLLPIILPKLLLSRKDLHHRLQPPNLAGGLHKSLHPIQ
jgi:hypothetical protein